MGALTPECIEFEVLTFDITMKGYDTTKLPQISANYDFNDPFSSKHVSTKITHVGPKGNKYTVRDRRDHHDDDGDNDDKFVKAFLSSKFVGESGKVAQFEAITAGPDLGSHISKKGARMKRKKGADYYLADDLMLEWQLSPIPELREQGVEFEVLTFDVKRSSIEREVDDYDLVDPKKLDDQRVVSQIQLIDDESNMITDAESGMIFEMLSFDLNAK